LKEVLFIITRGEYLL
jgi:hypothetical protein